MAYILQPLTNKDDVFIWLQEVDFADCYTIYNQPPFAPLSFPMKKRLSGKKSVVFTYWYIICNCMFFTDQFII